MPDTTTRNVNHARTVLEERHEDRVVLSVPETDYRIHLDTYKPVEIEPGKRAVGTIRAQARRIDVCGTGGRFVEPVYGRPRRVQGRIVAVDPVDQTVTIDAGVPIVAAVQAPQRAEQFEVGAIVTCAVLAGSTFTPA